MDAKKTLSAITLVLQLSIHDISCSERQEIATSIYIFWRFFSNLFFFTTTFAQRQEGGESARAEKISFFMGSACTRARARVRAVYVGERVSNRWGCRGQRNQYRVIRSPFSAERFARLTRCLLYVSSVLWSRLKKRSRAIEEAKSDLKGAAHDHTNKHA